MLDILHVMPSLGHGGAEQNLLTFLRQLPRSRYRNHLAWLGGDDTLRKEFESHVDTMLELDGTGRLGRLRATAELARWIRRRRPDVIHAQLIDAQLVARVAALAASRKPVVTTWQCVLYHDTVDFGGSKVVRECMRIADWFTGTSDRRFIAVSEYVASECSRDLHVPRDRVEVIYNAIDPERFRPRDAETLARTRAGLGVPADARLLLSVARLHPQKAHKDMVDAMPDVVRRVPNAYLLFAGRGPLEDSLREQAARLGVSDHVRLLGARSDVAVLYQLADQFVFPSYYEGLSVALIEALANGLPAVVSDIPQNREIGERLDSVRFVPTSSPTELADGIVDLLEGGKTMQKIARDYQEGVRERFASSTLAARFGQTLERAAGVTAA